VLFLVVVAAEAVEVQVNPHGSMDTEILHGAQVRQVVEAVLVVVVVLVVEQATIFPTICRQIITVMALPPAAGVILVILALAEIMQLLHMQIYMELYMVALVDMVVMEAVQDLLVLVVAVVML
jgi:hypothetical protein